MIRRIASALATACSNPDITAASLNYHLRETALAIQNADPITPPAWRLSKHMLAYAQDKNSIGSIRNYVGTTWPMIQSVIERAETSEREAAIKAASNVRRLLRLDALRLVLGGTVRGRT